MIKKSDEIKTKVLIGGIADGENVKSFLNELSNTKKAFDDYSILNI